MKLSEQAVPRIYLAGKVPKGPEIGVVPDWRASYMAALSCVPRLEFLSPEDPSLDESQPLEIFGHDCYLVRCSDIVVVNASTKMGVGTSQEMVIAKYFGKYVYTVLPRDTEHRRSNLQMHGSVIKDWMHPFVVTMSDVVFDDLEGLCAFMVANAESLLDLPVKSIEIVEKGIAHYLSHSCHPRQTE